PLGKPLPVDGDPRVGPGHGDAGPAGPAPEQAEPLAEIHDIQVERDHLGLPKPLGERLGRSIAVGDLWHGICSVPRASWVASPGRPGSAKLRSPGVLDASRVILPSG